MSCNCAARATYRRPNGLQSAWWKPRVAPASRPLATTPILREQSPSHFRPRITEPSIWRSIVPKFLRNDRSSSPPVKSSTTATTKPPQNFNPITVYIVLFLLIGSNAINQIGLKNDLQNYKRSTDSKIELLKEVIQRIHRGEDVDVAAALGTGNEEKEQEWEAVIREIEKEDEVPDAWKRKSRQQELGSDDKSKTKIKDTEDVSQAQDAGAGPEEKVTAVRSARFY